MKLYLKSLGAFGGTLADNQKVLPRMSPFASLACYISDQGQENEKETEV